MYQAWTNQDSGSQTLENAHPPVLVPTALPEQLQGCGDVQQLLRDQGRHTF